MQFLLLSHGEKRAFAISPNHSLSPFPYCLQRIHTYVVHNWHAPPPNHFQSFNSLTDDPTNDWMPLPSWGKLGTDAIAEVVFEAAHSSNVCLFELSCNLILQFQNVANSIAMSTSRWHIACLIAGKISWYLISYFAWVRLDSPVPRKYLLKRGWLRQHVFFQFLMCNFPDFSLFEASVADTFLNSRAWKIKMQERPSLTDGINSCQEPAAFFVIS